MNNSPSKIGTFFKGMGMGIAEVIPGVSGGTIAFITGIYETLLNSITAFTPKLFGEFTGNGLAGVWKKINGNFLVFLFAGMAMGFGAGVFGVTHLLENYPLLLWSFFFGLIFASSIYIGTQVSRWTWKEILIAILAACLAYFITIAAPAQGSEAPWYIFISGVIAISALMLPGLSGSFMLLLLGMYTFILPKIREALSLSFEAIITVSIFAAGCLVGVLTFSHLLSWTFRNYRNITLATLTGFMVGSLNKVWPWQEVLSTRINSGGEEVIAFSKSVLPETMRGLADNFLYGNNPQVGACVLLIGLGIVFVYVLSRFDQQKGSSL